MLREHGVVGSSPTLTETPPLDSSVGRARTNIEKTVLLCRGSSAVEHRPDKTGVVRSALALGTK